MIKTVGIGYQKFKQVITDKCCLFEELSIWNEEKYRNLQGNYPVIWFCFSGETGEN